MYTERLFTLYGAIGYVPTPWEEVAFEDGIIRLVRPRYLRPEELWNPADREPGFWRAVRSMAFRFRDGDQGAVREFYQRYGAFGFPADRSERTERWDTVATALDWFRVLTLIIEWVKQQKAGPLWDLFRSAPRRTDQEPASVTLFPGPSAGVYHVPGIYFVPWPFVRRRQVYWFHPSTDDELYIAAWRAAVDAVRGYMQKVVIVPRTQDGRAGSPAVTFSFIAKGALQAAFLQWFFQEMAPVNVTKCEAEGCPNPVLPPRERFCSETCRQREKKRRQRARARAGGEETA
ncbi:hypothetical protein [Caldinitratiruptor microaerophilus]|uniref:Uncharacterized protein n=1 Tax=Caldinitratiruptor microaerophilus TaxID=671077 RepID=A0AA35CLC3_9FIRM|nr:hypothetical protein [Caldinitratiruptor microaerophilus]BDG59622.1 hypothetical protein caldi_07120 [Caldinitratiruptor microaerophilus]